MRRRGRRRAMGCCWPSIVILIFDLIELIEVTHVVEMELKEGDCLCKRYRTLVGP